MNKQDILKALYENKLIELIEENYNNLDKDDLKDVLLATLYTLYGRANGSKEAHEATAQIIVELKNIFSLHN